MPVSKKRLQLTNRGGSGLYRHLTDEEREYLQKKLQENGDTTREDKIKPKGKGSPHQRLQRKTKNNIAESLQSLIVDIDQLNPDPENSRIHPMVNMQAIRDSLEIYGQVKPIVVRREGMIVVAGNGTLQAAKDLGWTQIAASIVEMTHVEASGYGLADNRTAELAKWDFLRVKAIDKLLQEFSHPIIGWSDDTLLVLRMQHFTQRDGIDDSVYVPESKIKIILRDDKAITFLKVKQSIIEYLKIDDLEDDATISALCEFWQSEEPHRRGA